MGRFYTFEKILLWHSQTSNTAKIQYLLWIKEQKESKIKQMVVTFNSHTANINPVRQNPQEKRESLTVQLINLCLIFFSPKTPRHYHSHWYRCYLLTVPSLTFLCWTQTCFFVWNLSASSRSPLKALWKHYQQSHSYMSNLQSWIFGPVSWRVPLKLNKDNVFSSELASAFYFNLPQVPTFKKIVDLQPTYSG